MSGSKAPRSGCSEETGSPESPLSPGARVPALSQSTACGFISRALQRLPDWRPGSQASWQVSAQVAVPAAGALTRQGDLSSLLLSLPSYLKTSIK